jgi:hypothetical protein
VSVPADAAPRARRTVEIVPLPPATVPALTRALPVIGARPGMPSDFGGEPAADDVRAARVVSLRAPEPDRLDQPELDFEHVQSFLGFGGEPIRVRLGLEDPPPAVTMVLTDDALVIDLTGAATPSPLAPPLRPAEPVERRRLQLAGRQVLRTGTTTLSRLACPSCHQPARVDIADVFNGRLYLSCDPCERMWQDQVRVEPAHPSQEMRD